MTSRLIGLRVENYKQIEVVNLDFPVEGGTFQIAGENEAGKTSTLDAIETAIAGNKGSALKQKKPIHTGANQARVIATFDDIIIERVFKANGTTALSIKSTETGKALAPKETLERLYSHVALDPFAFSKLDDAEQVNTLLPLIGIDPAPFDAKIRDEEESRTIVGRDVRSLKAQLDALPDPIPGLPAEEISVADLSAQLQEALAANEAKRIAEDKAVRAVANVNRANDAVIAAKEVVARAEADLDLAKSKAQLADSDAKEFVHDAGALPAEVDVDPIREAIATSETKNRGVRERATRLRIQAEHKKASETYETHTSTIASTKKAKADKLASAVMPVPGLAIDPESNVLLLDGEPFSQASTARRIVVGTAIAMALNPELRLIIVRDASLLDSRNREVMDMLAKANEFLVLLEIAGKGDDGTGVLLVDGMVAEVRK